MSLSVSAEKIAELKEWLHSVSREQRWCILVNADPDAMGAAEALKRIVADRARMDICHINEITRPDNLAMIRTLHIRMTRWKAALKSKYTHFALVDSQPHHNESYKDVHFSVIIDHHPLPEVPYSIQQPGFMDIQPEKCAACTIMTEYLRALHLRPSHSLASGMLLGIRCDTNLFERSGGKDDLEAYQWLSNRADPILIRKVVRSEYLRDWLPYFARACTNLRHCRRTGAQVFLGDVETADMLVAIADFFTRVHGLRWIAVSGIVRSEKAVVIFRGNGTRDVGRLADACFHDVGSGGGHKAMARAEFPISNLPCGTDCGHFIEHRLETRKLRQDRRSRQDKKA